jgi:hypothetical protein
MKMYIPNIGDKIQLSKNWQFPCFLERRNYDFIRKMRPDVTLPDSKWGLYREDSQSYAITLPKGTILRIDRVYIRQTATDFASVSFIVSRMPGTTAKSDGLRGFGRFWAKLVDVNEIEFKVFEGELPKLKNKVQQ